jgi:hypothetical protein
MARLKSNEIIKLLEILIGDVEAVGESNADERRLENLKTLIDVTDWCMDGLEFAMESGQGRFEASMQEISHTAKRALDGFRNWLNNN